MNTTTMHSRPSLALERKVGSRFGASRPIAGEGTGWRLLCLLLATAGPALAADAPAMSRSQNAPPEAYLPGDPLPYFGTEDPFNFQLGAVEVFMLDGRFYRENWRRPGASMLGPVQKRWLLESLRRSTATFKLLVSGVPWAFDSKTAAAGGIANDTWAGHPEEREEIFDLIAREKISGVLLLSGDRHRADVRIIPRPGAYPLYEMETARLTNANFHPPHGETLFVYTEMQTFSVVSFETRGGEPFARLEIVNIEGNTVWQREVPLRELIGPGWR